MKSLFVLFSILLCLESWAQRNHQGPSSLEGEFIKQSNIKMPVVYTNISGIYFNFLAPSNDVDETEDDLLGDVTGMTVNAGPIAYGSLERIKRVVNEEVSSGKDLQIEMASPESPFVLIESRKWDLGAGFELYSKLPMPIGLIGGSIAFLHGKNYYSVRHFSKRQEVRPRLQLPITAEDLQSWKVGDQLFYSTRGGAVFNVFLGLRPFITLGPEYIHSGSYRIKVQLLEKDLLEIEVVTTRTDSFGLEAVNLPLKLEFSKGKGHLNSLVYHFDLKSQNALKGIALLFHGRFDLTNQEMLNSDGRIKLSTRINHTYTSLSGKFGVPLVSSIGGGLGWSMSEGEIEQGFEVETKKYEVYSSTNVREYYTKGWLSSRKWFSENITSTVLRAVEGEGSVITSLYSWSLAKNNMNQRLLAKRLSKLAMIFGLPKLKQITFPAKRLGYMKADFSINFSGSDVLALLNTANVAVMGTIAQEALLNDFQQMGYRTFCRFREELDCLRRHSLLIKKKHKTLLTLVQELDSLYKDDEIKMVTAKLTNIIKHLFSSRYLTRAFADLRPGMMFELRLEGEKIKKHIIPL